MDESTATGLSSRPGGIGECRWADLRDLRVRGSEPIPTLDEVLEAWPDARVNIDPKHDAVVEPLAGETLLMVGADAVS